MAEEEANALNYIPIPEEKKNKNKRKRSSRRIDLAKFHTIMIRQRPCDILTQDKKNKRKRNSNSNSEANKFTLKRCETLTLTKKKEKKVQSRRKKASGFFFFRKTIWNIPSVLGKKMKQFRQKYRQDWKKFGLKKFFIIKGMVVPDTGGKVVTGAVINRGLTDEERNALDMPLGRIKKEKFLSMKAKPSYFFFFKKRIWNIPCVLRRVRKKKQFQQKNFRSRKAWDNFFRKRELAQQRVMMIQPALLTSHSKPIVIIRIQGKKYIHPTTRKVLFSLGLRRLFSAVFVKPTERIIGKLQRVASYVTYGYPNLESIKELLYKKGHAKIDERKVSLTDSIIGQELGKFGICSMEDMVHQIYNVGPHFQEVVRFIWPFELNKPSDGFKGSKTLFKNGGDAGNREDSINELINKMN